MAIKRGGAAHNVVLAALMSGRKNDVIPPNGDFKRKQCAYFGFSKQNPTTISNHPVLHISATK
jgi:hypothetical protein